PGVREEVGGLNEELRALPLKPAGAVPPHAAAEDRGEPVPGEAVLRTHLAGEGLLVAVVHSAHPPGAPGAAGAVPARVLLGEHDRVRGAVREGAWDTGCPVPV